MTSQLGPEPTYCKIHLGRPLTPSQWTACWKYGWDEPTTTMTRLGHAFGHDALLAIIAAAIIVFLIVRSVSRT